MKRETTDEKDLGVHDAMIDSVKTFDVQTENLVNIADPYDGFTRNIPSSAFILPVLAEVGIPAISQGVEKLLVQNLDALIIQFFKLLGLDVNASHLNVAERMSMTKILGYGSKNFFPKLNNLMSLKNGTIKRPVVTTRSSC